MFIFYDEDIIGVLFLSMVLMLGHSLDKYNNGNRFVHVWIEKWRHFICSLQIRRTVWGLRQFYGWGYRRIRLKLGWRSVAKWWYDVSEVLAKIEGQGYFVCVCVCIFMFMCLMMRTWVFINWYTVYVINFVAKWGYFGWFHDSNEMLENIDLILWLGFKVMVRVRGLVVTVRGWGMIHAKDFFQSCGKWDDSALLHIFMHSPTEPWSTINEQPRKKLTDMVSSAGMKSLKYRVPAIKPPFTSWIFMQERVIHSSVCVCVCIRISGLANVFQRNVGDRVCPMIDSDLQLLPLQESWHPSTHSRWQPDRWFSSSFGIKEWKSLVLHSLHLCNTILFFCKDSDPFKFCSQFALKSHQADIHKVMNQHWLKTREGKTGKEEEWRAYWCMYGWA